MAFTPFSLLLHRQASVTPLLGSVVCETRWFSQNSARAD